MRVIGGRYEGDTGLIVRVLDVHIVLFSDLTMHELKVLPRDLQLCTDMATGVDSLGQFQFGDMVQIDPQTVGVIVQIQKENFQVTNPSCQGNVCDRFHFASQSSTSTHKVFKSFNRFRS